MHLPKKVKKEVLINVWHNRLYQNTKCIPEQ